MIDWWSLIQIEHKVVTRLLSVKQWGICLNVVSNSFEVSLTKSFPVVQEKMTSHFCDSREFWTDKR